MQFVEVPDFLINATNVYRTDGYIVRQELRCTTMKSRARTCSAATPISYVRPSVTESMRKSLPTGTS